MSIKDDAHRNLFEGTKNFLARIIGCTMIWRLNYRNSWCAIVYKKTEKSFEVVAEAHNPTGIAVAQYPIIDKTNLELIQPTQQPTQQPIQQINNNLLWKPQVETNNVKQLQPPQMPQVTLTNIYDSTNTLQPPSQKVILPEEKEQISTSNIELIKKTDKLTEEVRELKLLVLEQSKLIKQLLENKKSE